jgi:cysteine desulfurase
MEQNPIYFDHAATTFPYPEVIDVMKEQLATAYGNPSSSHSVGRKSKALVENARRSIARYLGCQAKEIFFTSCGTEADAWVLQAAVRDLGVQRIITSSIEHQAVLANVEQLSRQNIKVDHIKYEADGEISLAHLKELLEDSDQKTLVCLMHVNNEIGNLSPIDEIADLCQEYQALFHCDAVQSVGKLPIDLHKTRIDFLAASAHKFHGPKGVGFAFIREGHQLQPMILGGEQERGKRAGTENLTLITGMAKALDIRFDNLSEKRRKVLKHKHYFIDQIKEAIPGIIFNGNCLDDTKSAEHIVNIRIPVKETKEGMLLFQMDLKGIMCSRGSACQSGAQTTSYVLKEIYPQEDLLPNLRFSFDTSNTFEEIDYCVRELRSIVEQNPV